MDVDEIASKYKETIELKNLANKSIQHTNKSLEEGEKARIKIKKSLDEIGNYDVPEVRVLKTELDYIDSNYNELIDNKKYAEKVIIESNEKIDIIKNLLKNFNMNITDLKKVIDENE